MTRHVSASESSTVIVLYFDSGTIHEKALKNVEEIEKLKEKIFWIRVVGKVNERTIKTVAKTLNISIETMESMLTVRRTPLVELSENLIVVSFRAMRAEEDTKRPRMSAFFAILMPKTIITWEQRKDDVFEKIKENILKRVPKEAHPEEILYEYLEEILENIYRISEEIWDELEVLEDKVLVEPSEQILRRVQSIKRILITMRKTTRSIREVANKISMLEDSFLNKRVLRRFENIYKHAVDIMDSIEVLSEILSSILDIYLSSVGNKTNEIMKVLTIIGTIFIPLTFITGIYGMNFRYMPELYWRWSYPIVLIGMLLIGIAMLFYFRRKGWI